MTKLAVNIDVDDLPRAVAFYRDALGLTPVRRLGEAAVELEGAAAPIYLLQKAGSTPPFSSAPGGRDYRRHWTPVHLDFVVDDIRGALDRALAAGARAESIIEPYGWGLIVLMSDPFGHGFCLLTVDEAALEAQATPYAG